MSLIKVFRLAILTLLVPYMLQRLVVIAYFLHQLNLLETYFLTH